VPPLGLGLGEHRINVPPPCDRHRRLRMLRHPRTEPGASIRTGTHPPTARPRWNRTVLEMSEYPSCHAITNEETMQKRISWSCYWHAPLVEAQPLEACPACHGQRDHRRPAVEPKTRPPTCILRRRFRRARLHHERCQQLHDADRQSATQQREGHRIQVATKSASGVSAPTVMGTIRCTPPALAAPAETWRSPVPD